MAPKGAGGYICMYGQRLFKSYVHVYNFARVNVGSGESGGFVVVSAHHKVGLSVQGGKH